mmetsp:Transcript_9798/g.28915  ORF Transcript_9798/g.28915 Transcript_9798/m.28915 type:complete len:218 (-) Transcript_9798:364-1017(-)
MGLGAPRRARGRHERRKVAAPGDEVGVSAVFRDTPLAEEDNAMRLVRELHLVGHEHHRGVAREEVSTDAPLEDALGHVSVQRGQGVVHDHNLGPRVHGSRNGDALLLPPRQIDAALPNLRLVPGGERLEVVVEGGEVDGLGIAFSIELGEEEHVVAHRGVEDPRGLGYIRHRPVQASTPSVCAHLSQQGGEERGLARAHGAHHHGQLPGARAEVDLD